MTVERGVGARAWVNGRERWCARGWGGEGEGESGGRGGAGGTRGHRARASFLRSDGTGGSRRDGDDARVETDDVGATTVALREFFVARTVNERRNERTKERRNELSQHGGRRRSLRARVR
jgi:hypothetical protein